MPQWGDETGDFLFASAHIDRCVLITGAGGYIGSALVKAIAGTSPRRILLLDSAEHNLFEIQRYLESPGNQVPYEAVLGTVNDADLLDSIFSRYRPEIIYHAARLQARSPIGNQSHRGCAEQCNRHLGSGASGDPPWSPRSC